MAFPIWIHIIDIVTNTLAMKMQFFFPRRGKKVDYPTATPLIAAWLSHRVHLAAGGRSIRSDDSDSGDTKSLCYEFVWHLNTICGVAIRENSLILFTMEPRWGFNSRFYCLTNNGRLEVIIYIE